MAESGGSILGTLYYTVEYQVDQASLQRVQQAGSQAGLSGTPGGAAAPSAGAISGGYGRQTMAPALPVARVSGNVTPPPAPSTSSANIGAAGTFGAEVVSSRARVGRINNAEGYAMLLAQRARFPEGSSQRALIDRQLAGFEMTASPQQQMEAAAMSRTQAAIQQAGGPMAYLTMQPGGGGMQTAYAAPGNLALTNQTLALGGQMAASRAPSFFDRFNVSNPGMLARTARLGLYQGLFTAAEIGKIGQTQATAQTSMLGTSTPQEFLKAAEQEQLAPLRSGMLGEITGLLKENTFGYLGEMPSVIERNYAAQQSVYETRALARKADFEAMPAQAEREAARGTLGGADKGVSKIMRESARAQAAIQARQESIQTQISDLAETNAAVFKATTPEVTGWSIFNPEKGVDVYRWLRSEDARTQFQAAQIGKRAVLDQQSIEAQAQLVQAQRDQKEALDDVQTKNNESKQADYRQTSTIRLAMRESDEGQRSELRDKQRTELLEVEKTGDMGRVGATIQRQEAEQDELNQRLTARKVAEVGTAKAGQTYYETVTRQGGREYEQDKYIRRFNEITAESAALSAGPQSDAVRARQAEIAAEKASLQPRLTFELTEREKAYQASTTEVQYGIAREPLKAQIRAIQYQGKKELEALPPGAIGSKAIEENTAARIEAARQQYADQTRAMRLGLTAQVGETALEAQGKPISAAAQGLFDQSVQQINELATEGRANLVPLASEAGKNRLAALKRQAIYGGHARSISSPYGIQGAGTYTNETEADITASIDKLSDALDPNHLLKQATGFSPTGAILTGQTASNPGGNLGGTSTGGTAGNNLSTTNNILNQMLQELRNL